MKRKAIGVITVLLLFGIVIVAVPAVYCLVLVGTKTTFVDAVQEKWIKSSGGTDQIYLVSTVTHGVLQDTDEMFFLKFDSSDVYAKIQPGHTYRFTVIGWRIPFFSMYQNILTVEEV